jgi:hypothetical protein
MDLRMEMALQRVRKKRMARAPKSILFFKHMSWLGQIRSDCRDDTWSASLW